MKSLIKYLHDNVPALESGSQPSLPQRRGNQTRHVADPRGWPKSFIVVVVIPSLLSILYFGLIATPRYISHAEVMVQSKDGPTRGELTATVMSSITGGMGGNLLGAGEAAVVAEYVHSQSMLEQLEKSVGLRRLWSTDKADFFSRLSPRATREQFLEYFLDRVTVEFQPGSSIMQIRAEAFSPQEAQQIVSQMVVHSEELLNAMTRRQQADAIAFARTEVENAEERLKAARLAMSDFRRVYGDVDPSQSAAATGGLIFALTQQLTTARAELGAVSAFMQPDSTQIKSLRSKIASLEQQISEVRRRMSATVGDTPVNAKLVQWEALVTEHEFALKGYESASLFLENARMNAQRQQSYIIDFVKPNLPEAAERPERMKAITSVVVGAFLAWAIGGMLVTAIREQARI
ncbi:MAG TPA: hypothetical protein VK196_18860 [Magnetospirillum sp.]|nr:hypothetical protein [Magnetospirillum sp.]